MSKFLITRGLWLILLEFTVIRVIVWFNVDFHFALMLQVIWVIGVSMIALAGLIHLPLRAVAAASIAMIALHNALDRFESRRLLPARLGLILGFRLDDLASAGSDLLHADGSRVGALSAGSLDRRVGRRLLLRRGLPMGTGAAAAILLKLGGGMLIGFVALRAVNLYGDPSRWSVQKMRSSRCFLS